MTTPITPAHRSWRTKVFAATWLSYVGYYFCRKPFSAAKSSIEDAAGWSTETTSEVFAAYLIAYAIGQFLASQMGTRIGPRRNVLIGMAASVLVTVAMGVTLSAPIMGGLLFVNGIAQATGWSGNVGTMASWFHRHERGRVMGLWSTNFTIGSIASNFAMSAVIGYSYQWCFFSGAAVLAAVWLQFYLFQRNRPEDVGLSPIDDPVTAIDEARTPEPPATGFMGLSRRAWVNLLLVGGFYFCAKFVRYAVWSWAPYFMVNGYGRTEASANLWVNLFDICGLPGIYATGWISDRYFGSKRAGVSLIMCLAMTGAAGALYLSTSASFPLFVTMLALTGFTLFGPDALLSGAGAIDIGGRHRATFAAAFISGIGSSGAVLQELAIGKAYVKGGSLGPVFAMLLGGCLLSAVFCAALVWRNRRGGAGI